jgi:hypothetical protein
MTALYAKFQALSPTPFVTVSRQLKQYFDVSAECKPALFMTEHTEKSLTNARLTPGKSEWDIMLFIYARVPDDGESIGASILNNLLDAVDTALKPDVNGNVSLGGIVYRVWPDGLIHKDPGDLDGEAIALYPIKIRPP